MTLALKIVWLVLVGLTALSLLIGPLVCILVRVFSRSQFSVADVSGIVIDDQGRIVSSDHQTTESDTHSFNLNVVA